MPTLLWNQKLGCMNIRVCVPYLSRMHAYVSTYERVHAHERLRAFIYWWSRYRVMWTGRPFLPRWPWPDPARSCSRNVPPPRARARWRWLWCVPVQCERTRGVMGYSEPFGLKVVSNVSWERFLTLQVGQGYVHWSTTEEVSACKCMAPL